MGYLVSEEAVPITRACAHLGLARSSYYMRPASKAKADEPVVEVLNQVVGKPQQKAFIERFSRTY